jgi:alanyl-tRNA synthetase
MASPNQAGGGVSLGVEHTAFLQQQLNLQPTKDASKYDWDTAPSATLLAVFDPSSQSFLPSTNNNQEEEEGGMQQALEKALELRKEEGSGSDDEDGLLFGFVLDSTSFYSEAGGQAADTGTLEFFGGSMAVEVVDVQSYAGFVLHVGRVVTVSPSSSSSTDKKEGTSSSSSSSVVCKVDYARRRKIAPNHTVTHILNQALRKVLGGDVAQKVMRTLRLKHLCIILL